MPVKESVASKFLDMCQLEMKYIIPGHINWYAGKYIGYGLCAVADAIMGFTEVYRDRNDKEHGEVSKVRRNP
jgi:hypothetical protein